MIIRCAFLATVLVGLALPFGTKHTTSPRKQPDNEEYNFRSLFPSWKKNLGIHAKKKSWYTCKAWYLCKASFNLVPMVFPGSEVEHPSALPQYIWALSYDLPTISGKSSGKR